MDTWVVLVYDFSVMSVPIQVVGPFNSRDEAYKWICNCPENHRLSMKISVVCKPELAFGLCDHSGE